MTRRARSVDELRARYLAGGNDPRRVARAERLAMISAATEVLFNWSKRAERATSRYWAAVEREDLRAWPIGPFPPWRRRPPALEIETWRALEVACDARAREQEWFHIVESLLDDMPAAAPVRMVVVYGDDGAPIVMFPREPGRIDQ